MEFIHQKQRKNRRKVETKETREANRRQRQSEKEQHYLAILYLCPEMDTNAERMKNKNMKIWRIRAAVVNKMDKQWRTEFARTIATNTINKWHLAINESKMPIYSTICIAANEIFQNNSSRDLYQMFQSYFKLRTVFMRMPRKSAVEMIQKMQIARSPLMVISRHYQTNEIRVRSYFEWNKFPKKKRRKSGLCHKSHSG